jgi:hypothetical protein
MLEENHVQYRISQFEEVSRRRRVHDSFNYCFENAMGKIVQYEVRNDRIVAVEDELLELVKRTLLGGERVFKYHRFDAEIVVAYFVQAGIREDTIVREFVRNRIERVHDCIKTYGYDIHADKTQYRGIPKAFHDRPLVRPEIANADYSDLPRIWDIESFHAVYDGWYKFDEGHRKKVEEILSYTMDDAYQRLLRGYGIQRTRPRVYHSVGWSVHLPEIDNLGAQLPTDLLYFVHLLSNYPTLARSDWFRQAMAILE